MSGTTGWAITPPPQRTCVLCGETSSSVVHGLIRWRVGAPFGSGPRCPDAAACWQRAMDQGEEWLVADGQPARVAPDPGAQPDRVIEPDPDPPTDALDFGTPPEEPA